MANVILTAITCKDIGIEHEANWTLVFILLWGLQRGLNCIEWNTSSYMLLHDLCDIRFFVMAYLFRLLVIIAWATKEFLQPRVCLWH